MLKKVLFLLILITFTQQKAIAKKGNGFYVGLGLADFYAVANVTTHSTFIESIGSYNYTTGSLDISTYSASSMNKSFLVGYERTFSNNIFIAAEYNKLGIKENVKSDFGGSVRPQDVDSPTFSSKFDHSFLAKLGLKMSENYTGYIMFGGVSGSVGIVDKYSPKTNSAFFSQYGAGQKYSIGDSISIMMEYSVINVNDVVYQKLSGSDLLSGYRDIFYDISTILFKLAYSF